MATKIAKEELKTDCIVIGSVQHSGTYFLTWTVGRNPGRAKIKADNCQIIIPNAKDGRAQSEYVSIHGHFDHRTELLKELAKTRKMVIPLRHPALIAVSWKARGEDGNRRTPTFLDQWVRMDEFPDAFFFTMEEKPFDDLETYLGRPVNRIKRYVNKMDYEFPTNVLEYLGDDRHLVEKALQTDVGKRFYS